MMHDKLALIINVMLMLSTGNLFAQVTAEDYKRADNLSALASDKVFHSDIRPVWIGSRYFLYENNTPEGLTYTIVDAIRGSKTPAFDQVRFAVSLGSASGQQIDPGKLPVSNITFSDRLRSFAFVFQGYNWICNMKDYSLVRRDRVLTRENTRLNDWFFRDELSNSPVISPDKQWTAFIKNYNLWIRSSTDNKEYQLSSDGGMGEYYSSFIKWSPDSRKLITCLVRPAERRVIHFIESSPSDQLQPKHYSFEYPKPGDALPQFFPQLFEVESGRHLKVDKSTLDNQFTVNNIFWSADSRYFTFEYKRRGNQLCQVLKVDANTGNMSVIINETSPTFIDYSYKKYRYDIEATNEIIWASERDGWNHLYLFDSENGTVKNQITHGEWVVRGVTFIDAQKREIIFEASGKEPGDPYYIHYYKINFDGSGLVRLTEGNGTHEAYFSPDKKLFVDTWSRVDMPPVAVLRSAEDGRQLIVIERADASKLEETGIRYPEPFVAKGRDGVTDIYGIIIRPVDFDPSRKYPVIESIYAGPHGSFVPKSFRPFYGELHQLAELGFIIVQIDGMGTSNRSKAFHDVCWKNLKDAGFPDRILWLKAAAEKYPYIDLDRVGIFGGSAGGQNAAGALLFHPDFYKVAVAACGCHDNRMDKIWWNEQWMGWPVGEEYIASSNVENAWRLKGRLLLINGELDDNVDPASTEQMVNALIKEGKDFEYVFIPGARHISNGGTYGSRKRRDFFVKYLLGVDPPDWNMTGE